jgi:hypothetical protein
VRKRECVARGYGERLLTGIIKVSPSAAHQSGGQGRQGEDHRSKPSRETRRATSTLRRVSLS